MFYNVMIIIVSADYSVYLAYNSLKLCYYWWFQQIIEKFPECKEKIFFIKEPDYMYRQLLDLR